MATCRESHDAYIVGVDGPHGGGVAYGADAFLHVAHGDGTVTIRQTVVDHEIGNALLVHPVGGHIALMSVRQH